MSITQNERRDSDVSSDRGAATALEELHLAEAQLQRRRQSDCGPGESDRLAMRFIIEHSEQGREVTPSMLAGYLGITTASVTALLDRLGRGDMIEVFPHPGDRRKRLIKPANPSDDADVIDPMTAVMRELAEELSPQESELVGGYLRRVTEAVRDETARDDCD